MTSPPTSSSATSAAPAPATSATPAAGTSATPAAAAPAAPMPAGVPLAAFKPAAADLDGPTPADLLPSAGSHPVEVVRYQSVVLTDIPGAKPSRKLTGAIDLGEENLPFYDRPAEGMIVTTEQAWKVEGVTLGRLLHSLALAPGESTRVAVIDFDRRTRGTGAEATAERDVLTSMTGQDRSITELASSVAREEQFGASAMTQEALSTSASVSGGVSLGLIANFGASWSMAFNRALATSVARSTGLRSVAADAAQRISARTEQLATAARSRHMTVVRETSQAEREQVATRVVANYNHMHALSMQYYEVVQVYKVETKPVDIERCLFIPVKELTFTQNSLQRYKEVLAQAAPPDWAKQIRAAQPLGTAVRKLNGCAAVEAPTGELFEGVELLDLEGWNRAAYGVRKNDGAPVRFDPATRQWNPLPTAGLPDGLLKRIAPGKDMFWGIGANDRIYRYDGKTWQADPGSGRAIATGADGTTYMVGMDNYLYRRGNGWEKQTVLADDVAVVNRQRVWCCRQGKTWELNGTNWEERTSPGILSVVAAPDGGIWGVTRDNKVLMVKAGSSAWEAPPQAGSVPIANVTATRIVPADNGEFWFLLTNGALVRLLTAAREAVTPFDDKPPPDSGSATKIEVWWDDAGIRSIRLITPGRTSRYGDTGGSGVQQRAAFDFTTGDKLLSVDYWTGAAARGSLSGLRLTTQSGVVSFGPAASGTAPPDLTEDAGGAALCGLAGSTVRTGSRTYLASLGFYVRGGNVPQAVLDHLNDNRRYYSQVVWANADELTLSRIFANYSYTPPGGKADLLLGTLLDPVPVALTGNYLGFRWHFGSEQERQAWVKDRSQDSANLAKPVTATIAVATNGVFAESVLGRANAAEKIDLTRFWNWKDSPIPILPSEIAPIATGARAKDVDVNVAPLTPSAATLQQIQPLPDPAGIAETLRALATANMFRDITGLAEMSQVLGKGLELAAGNDKAAAERALTAMKTASEHMQAMSKMGLDFASTALTAGITGGVSLLTSKETAGNLSALGGLLNQAGGKSADGAKTTGGAKSSG